MREGFFDRDGLLHLFRPREAHGCLAALISKQVEQEGEKPAS
jgi:hypothetical protein